MPPGYQKFADRTVVARIHAAEAIAVVSDRLRMPNESAPLYTY